MILPPQERRIKFYALPDQAEFLEFPGKMAAIRGGVGSGKTTICAVWMLARMTKYPSASHYVVGADYPQLKRGFLASLRALLDNHGIEYTYRTTDGTITLDEYGATLQCLSSELADRIRSVEMDTVLLEEPQTWGNGADEIFSTIIGRLRGTPRAKIAHPDLQPQLRMSFNPPAIGTWLYDLIEKKWPLEGYPCWKFSVRDNYLLGAERQAEYIRLLENTYAEDRWPVEIDGEWATIGGDVYRGWDSDVMTSAPENLPPLAFDPMKPLLWALDFNVGFMSSIVAQAHVQTLSVGGWDRKPGREPTPIHRKQNAVWQRRVFYVLDELFLSDSGTPDVVTEFVKRHGAHARQAGVELYGDASGGSRSQTISSASAVRSNWDIVLDGLRRAGIPVRIKVPLSNPAVMDRINSVRAQFKTADGYGVVVDPQRCPELIADFVSVRFKPGTNDIDKTDTSPKGLRRTHLSDAYGYMIFVERALAAKAPLGFRGPFEG